MRRLGYAAALAVWLGAGSSATRAADLSPQKMLEIKPTQQSGVDYETPADQAGIDACKVETVTDAQKRAVGYALRDGQGKLLRRFISTNGGKSLTQWSYYQDGFEVYRESDVDGDRRLDECRWMNTGGTRIAVVQGNKIVGWKRLSAEEATKVAVQALSAGDASLVDSLVATSEELTAAGLPKEVVARVASAPEKRAEQVAALTAALKAGGEKLAWNRFDGAMPHAIPADPEVGVAKDLVLYENAMIFTSAPAAAGAQPAKLSMLQVPELIQLGEVWKFVELPRSVDPEKPVVAAAAGIRASLYETVGGAGPGGHDEAMEAPLRALAEFDKANNAAILGGDKREVAQFHLKRIPLLKAVADAAGDAEEKLSYNKQSVDSLVSAYQTGVYPKGREALDAVVKAGGPLASYASYRLIGADFVMRNEEPNGNFVANQKKWMGDLEEFLKLFPKADEASEVWLQLGSSNEFNAEEDKAREDYKKLVEDFPETLAGKKAAGALRRLDLEGKSFSIKGDGADGTTVDTAAISGKTVLVVFWASWGGQSVRRELPDLIKIAEKNADKGFQIVGVCLDNDKADLEAFQKEHNLPWPQIFEPNGIDGRLAVEYGIISLPTMFLVDAQGKVVNRNLRSASEVERQLEKTLAAKPAGVALGVK
ncbi:TlpA disulfide reductase family protein [Planctomyces sp. SH-PL62]|uniref:TlpA disulfide reductase family protein n=1 Tax=Planctomyces sp. SH-PL62 TaxID=1636152 RepID=UPI00078B8394|nr:TlpA disulfide reductase family protein [Planctomyces sp. SH-PL62]AMV40307.1 Thiol-disulfide oxidoreductase ResA [Planctomyces sp. SH-PL62]